MLFQKQMKPQHLAPEASFACSDVFPKSADTQLIEIKKEKLFAKDVCGETPLPAFEGR
jgi:hypothetical protein